MTALKRLAGKGGRKKEPCIRPPVVAGLFYPDQRQRLAEWIDRLLEKEEARGKEPARAVVVPHGSLTACGEVLAAVYALLRAGETAVVVAPSHTGSEKSWVLMDQGRWQTPLGFVSVDEKLARCLLEAVPQLEVDDEVHRDEHALEVQLPFLQRVLGVRRWLPIVSGDQAQESARAVGLGLAEVIRQGEERPLLVISADLSRYEPEEWVRRQDAQLLEAILPLDDQAFLKRVRELAHTTCAAAPLAAGLVAAQALGAREGVLVKYRTSAEVTGIVDSAVGFAGILIR